MTLEYHEGKLRYYETKVKEIRLYFDAIFMLVLINAVFVFSSFYSWTVSNILIFTYMICYIPLIYYFWKSQKKCIYHGDKIFDYYVEEIKKETLKFHQEFAKASKE